MKDICVFHCLYVIFLVDLNAYQDMADSILLMRRCWRQYTPKQTNKWFTCLVVNHKTLKLYPFFITRKWGKVLFWSVSLLPQLDNMSSPAGAIPSIFILNTFWSRLNTTNSTSSVSYETGLNSLLSVVDSYQASSSIILLDPCWLLLFVDDPDIDPACPLPLLSVDYYFLWMPLTLIPPTQVEVLKVDLTEETAGRRVSLTVANLPKLNSPPTCFYRWCWWPEWW